MTSFHYTNCVKSLSLVTVSVRQMKIDKVSGIAHSCTQGEHLTRKLRDGKRVGTNLANDIIEEELYLLKVKCRNVVVTKDEATLFPLRIKRKQYWKQRDVEHRRCKPHITKTD